MPLLPTRPDRGRTTHKPAKGLARATQHAVSVPGPRRAGTGDPVAVLTYRTDLSTFIYEQHIQIGLSSSLTRCSRRQHGAAGGPSCACD
jgi:hypothetical protein